MGDCGKRHWNRECGTESGRKSQTSGGLDGGAERKKEVTRIQRIKKTYL